MRINNKNKKAQVPEFNWLLVVIIGAVILFIAVLFSGKLIKLKGYESAAEIVPSFDILLNPFTSVGSMAKTIKLQDNIKAEIGCEQNSDYLLGRQQISVSSQGAFGKWSDFTEFPYYIYDKYIFADRLEGKIFYVFGKAFEMPFKIDEVIYMAYDEYCFVNAPAGISNEITDLGLDAIKASDILECSEKSKKVCFGEGVCDIEVKCDDSECSSGYAEKEENGQSERMYFITDALMYGAVFGSYDNYNCNVARLMERINKLSSIYNEKADKLKIRGCMPGETESLMSKLGTDARTAENPDNNKKGLYETANQLENANSAAECPLF